MSEVIFADNKQDYARDYEIIKSQIYMMSRPLMNHVAIASNVNTIFSVFLKGSTCVSYPEPDVYLDDENNFIPDVVILCDRSKRKRRGIYGAPDLVVEILSPSTAKRDNNDKKDVYAMYGVREYWIIDPIAKAISVYRLNDGSLELRAIYYYVPAEEVPEYPDDDQKSIVPSFTCGIFEDLVINLEDVFRNVE